MRKNLISILQFESLHSLNAENFPVFNKRIHTWRNLGSDMDCTYLHHKLQID